MKDKKVVFEFFTIAQYQQEEEYLCSVHEKGWQLEKIAFPSIYRFEKCEPRKVTYRLDYNPESEKNKAEYVKMFADCGWEYLFDYMGYSYFCKGEAVDGEREEIFCDNASRMDMLKRVFRGRMVTLIILFLCVILPQFCSNTVGHGSEGTPQKVFSVVFLAMAFLYMSIFAAMTCQFYQLEKRILPEKPGIKYKYAGILLVMIFILVGMGTMFFFGR